jgi:hypothetical protein
VAGVAAFAAFTPYRTDEAERPTGGLRRLYEMHALLPRLGLFARDLTTVPYDYDELLDAIAPRPTLLYTPMGDRDATYADVKACVDASKRASLTHIAPDQITKMEGNEADAAVAWLTQVAKQGSDL